MIEEILLGWISVFVVLVSLGLLVVCLWKREKVTSEFAWDMLKQKTNLLRWVFALSFASLLIYLMSESAALLSFEYLLPGLEDIHEVGEVIHMFLLAVALVVVIPVVSAMLGDESAP